MHLQKFLTPMVLASLVISQGYLPMYAQQPSGQSAPQPAQQVLNNDSVIKLVKAGLSDDLITSTISSSPGVYDTSADGMIALKSAGVSDRVVAAMVSKANAVVQPVVATVPALPPMPPPEAAKVLLSEGADVYLAFDQDLSSKTAADGDAVAFVLTEDLKAGDVVIAKAGTKALGEVTHAARSEMMGKGGELNIRLDYLKVGPTKVHLRGTKGGEGNSGVGGAIALSLLVGVFGLLKHGKEVNVQKGTALHAYVSEDVSLPAAM